MNLKLCTISFEKVAHNRIKKKLGLSFNFSLSINLKRIFTVNKCQNEQRSISLDFFFLLTYTLGL